MEIDVTLIDANAFEGWFPEDLARVDEQASLEKFSGALLERLREEYPEARIDVRHEAFGVSDKVYVDDDDQSLDALAVRDIIGDIYGEMEWVVERA